jgi:hypothetical protein
MKCFKCKAKDETPPLKKKQKTMVKKISFSFPFPKKKKFPFLKESQEEYHLVYCQGIACFSDGGGLFLLIPDTVANREILDAEDTFDTRKTFDEEEFRPKDWIEMKPGVSLPPNSKICRIMEKTWDDYYF